MNKNIKYCFFFIGTLIHAENHKTITFFGGYDKTILSWIEACNISFNTEKTNSNTTTTTTAGSYLTTIANIENNQVKYRFGTSKPHHIKHHDPNHSKLDKKTNLIPQDFFAIKLDHSFDELTDNIYWGFSTAWMKANINSKQTTNQISFFKTSMIGVGGYAQYQDDEETDYSFCVKLSALAGPQWLGVKCLDTKFVSDTILTEKTIFAPLTLGTLVMFQIGFKLGLLEISAYAAYNLSSEVKFTINETTPPKTNQAKNVYCGIAIAPLFK